MMGRQNNDQRSLFYEFRLDEAVPDGAQVDAILDLTWSTQYSRRTIQPSAGPRLIRYL